ncbi:MAG: exo-alpha-sialidase [Clostridia bacterium]|nr:exo-alpha-sialidase [Clostridia bacterium]
MFITDKKKLESYYTPKRIWQGVPGIEVTSKGRIFSAFYSGGTMEEIGNYVMLVKSDDGINFSEPIAAAFLENHRCYDPCLWIDPLKRLWFIWSCAPDPAVYAVICDDPDAEKLTWSQEIKIGKDVMMNKPTVMSTGEWFFPIAVWQTGKTPGPFNTDKDDSDRRAFVYKSVDNGKSFVKHGGASVKQRSFDEHMFLELQDGRIAMYVRTYYGIGVSYSYDRGKTWTEGQDTGIGGPDSRFFIKRLASGRILLINHDMSIAKRRTHLTAFLSEDEGKTWKYKLLLDERYVSYPDASISDDGYIYITYDRERGGNLSSFDAVYSCAREILYSKITEEDIINGKVTSPESKLRCIISKLGKYENEDENPFNEIVKFSDKELAQHLIKKFPDKIIEKIFDYYPINCEYMSEIETDRLDRLVKSLEKEGSDSEKTIIKMISLIRSVSVKNDIHTPIVDKIKSIIEENLVNELSVADIAKKTGVSLYYMMHIFKKTTGITILEYAREAKLTRAKEALMNSDTSIGTIAQECGFGSSAYFSKVFSQSEGISPSEYRRILRHSEE